MFDLLAQGLPIPPPAVPAAPSSPAQFFTMVQAMFSSTTISSGAQRIGEALFLPIVTVQSITIGARSALGDPWPLTARRFQMLFVVAGSIGGILLDLPQILGYLSGAVFGWVGYFLPAGFNASPDSIQSIGWTLAGMVIDWRSGNVFDDSGAFIFQGIVALGILSSYFFFAFEFLLAQIGFSFLIAYTAWTIVFYICEWTQRQAIWGEVLYAGALQLGIISAIAGLGPAMAILFMKMLSNPPPTGSGRIAELLLMLVLSLGYVYLSFKMPNLIARVGGGTGTGGHGGAALGLFAAALSYIAAGAGAASEAGNLGGGGGSGDNVRARVQALTDPPESDAA